MKKKYDEDKQKLAAVIKKEKDREALIEQLRAEKAEFALKYEKEEKEHSNTMIELENAQLNLQKQKKEIETLLEKYRVNNNSRNLLEASLSNTNSLLDQSNKTGKVLEAHITDQKRTEKLLNHK